MQSGWPVRRRWPAVVSRSRYGSSRPHRECYAAEERHCSRLSATSRARCWGVLGEPPPCQSKPVPFETSARKARAFACSTVRCPLSPAAAVPQRRLRRAPAPAAYPKRPPVLSTRIWRPISPAISELCREAQPDGPECVPQEGGHENARIWRSSSAIPWRLPCRFWAAIGAKALSGSR